MRPDSPFPLRAHGISPGLLATAEVYADRSAKAAIRHPHGATVIELKTDSDHLYDFFVQNWGEAPSAAPVDATIVALRGDATYYGLDTSLDGIRFYNRRQRKVIFLAHEAYANMKVTVRGLCSQAGHQNVLWLHGCSLSIDLDGARLGVLLLGRSGGGKTTITATLRRMLGNRVKVVNDDWGAASLENLATVYTGERALHMKYISVNAHDPGIRPTPRAFPSEHYSADPTDPVSRMLISRERVFGAAGIAEDCPLTAIVLLRRSGSALPGISELGADPLRLIEAGEYSDYYDSVEPFFNGSLFLLSDDDAECQRGLYQTLLSRVEIVALGNVEYPETVAEHLLAHLRSQVIGQSRLGACEM